MIIKDGKQVSENGLVCKLEWIINAAKEHDIGPDIFVTVDGVYVSQDSLEIDEFGALVINVVTEE